MPFFKYLPALFLAAFLLQAVTAGSQSGPYSSDQASNITEAMAALDKAKAAFSVGDTKTALEAVWAAQEAIWIQAPLGMRNAAFVTEQPENFGTYTPKTGQDFKEFEPLIFYCEPVGYTQRKEADGTYSYSILGAFSIIDTDKNQTLGGQENLGPYEMHGYRTFSTETMLAMTIGIQGLPVGSYTLRVTLTDNLNQSKTAVVDKPFRLVGE
ncbi:MAG: hypothetical protein LBP22_10980 [Deltaproteobacteria bacterium]|jgi:hypothetical protein|nr:hypothetical protein [Deltaproteobacteria bacterium]